MRSPFVTLFLTTTPCDAFPFFGVRLFSETFFSMHLACTHTSSSHARHFRAKLRRKRVFLRGGGRRRSWPIIDENSASNLNYVHFFIEAASIKSSKTSSRTSRPRRHFWVINRGSFKREALTYVRNNMCIYFRNNKHLILLIIIIIRSYDLYIINCLLACLLACLDGIFSFVITYIYERRARITYVCDIL